MAELHGFTYMGEAHPNHLRPSWDDRNQVGKHLPVVQATLAGRGRIFAAWAFLELSSPGQASPTPFPPIWKEFLHKLLGLDRGMLEISELLVESCRDERWWKTCAFCDNFGQGGLQFQPENQTLLVTDCDFHNYTSM